VVIVRPGMSMDAQSGAVTQHTVTQQQVTQHTVTQQRAVAKSGLSADRRW